LFSSAAFSLAIVLIIAENLWVLAAALVLMILGKPESAAPPPAQPTHATRRVATRRSVDDILIHE
jgi:hypothetical protein